MYVMLCMVLLSCTCMYVVKEILGNVCYVLSVMYTVNIMYVYMCIYMYVCVSKFICQKLCRLPKGPSIYDVHTEGGGVRLRWTHVDGPAPCGRPHRKLKSTDVILSSSHAKKLASFLPEFRLWTEKSRNFSAI